MAGRHVFVAVPTHDGRLNIQTAYNLALMMPTLLNRGVSVCFGSMSECSIITVARNVLANEFLNTPATELLFIDSDVVVTADDVFRLLEHSDGKDIVAGQYPTKGDGAFYTPDFPKSADDELVFDGPLLKTDRAKTGFMLVKRYVFEKLRDDHPEWQFETRNGGTAFAFFDFALQNGKYVGEDYLFCDRAQAAGFACWLDMEINLPHVGQTQFVGNFFEKVVSPLLEAQQQSKLKVANG